MGKLAVRPGLLLVTATHAQLQQERKRGDSCNTINTQQRGMLCTPSHLLGLGHLGQDARESHVVGRYPVRAHQLQELGRHDPPPHLGRRIDEVRHEADVRCDPYRARLEREAVRRGSGGTIVPFCRRGRRAIRGWLHAQTATLVQSRLGCRNVGRRCLDQRGKSLASTLRPTKLIPRLQGLSPTKGGPLLYLNTIFFMWL